MTARDLDRQLVVDEREAPAAIRELATRLRPGCRVRPLWRNDLGGWTIRLDPPEPAAPARGESVVLKWVPSTTVETHPTEATPLDEAARLRWIAGRHPVPELLACGADETDGGQWILTRAIDGETAVAPRWRADPRQAVCALGEGLRALHEALDPAECPWEYWLAAASQEPVADADRVVLHGDACAPNTLLDARGRWVAHVDLGALGAGDRWLDLAVGAQSLGWNYGEGWEVEYFAAYGIASDPDRLRHWRELWNMA